MLALHHYSQSDTQISLSCPSGPLEIWRKALKGRKIISSSRNRHHSSTYTNSPSRHHNQLSEWAPHQRESAIKPKSRFLPKSPQLPRLKSLHSLRKNKTKRLPSLISASTLDCYKPSPSRNSPSRLLCSARRFLWLLMDRMFSPKQTVVLERRPHIFFLCCQAF